MRDFIKEIGAIWIPVGISALANVNTPAEWAEFEAKPCVTDKLHYIEFRHVYKTFDRPVLVDANFYVNAGETVAIIGRSGVGKSVSLGHIMGFLKPDEGRVFVAYQDITDFTEAQLREIRKKVTMVFQSGALFDSLTVGENILFSLELRSDYDEHNKEDVVDGLLSMVDMLQFKDAYPADLSTGYKRAVAIARALAAQPECILYDEPTTMVDPIMSDILAQLMLKLKRELKLTAVVVTHDLDLMRKVADTVVVLYQGQAIYFGPVADLEKSTHPHIRCVPRHGPRGTGSGPGRVARSATSASRNPAPLNSCRSADWSAWDRRRRRGPSALRTSRITPPRAACRGWCRSPPSRFPAKSATRSSAIRCRNRIWCRSGTAACRSRRSDRCRVHDCPSVYR